MKIRSRISAALAGSGLVLGCLALAAPAAHAAVGQFTLPVAYPQGVAMDALNWGGTGTSASCVSHTASTNAYVGVWKTTGAGCAAQFVPVALTINGVAPTGTGPFEIVYAPGGTVATNETGQAVANSVPNGFCVSTYANSSGTYARLRHCAATLSTDSSGHLTGTEGSASVPVTANAWQTFQSVGGTVDDPGAVQIETRATAGTGALCLNDKAFGGNGSNVVSYACAQDRANEAWNTPAFG